MHYFDLLKESLKKNRLRFYMTAALPTELQAPFGHLEGFEPTTRCLVYFIIAECNLEEKQDITHLPTCAKPSISGKIGVEPILFWFAVNILERCCRRGI